MSATSSSSMTVLRILCIHGYRQNAQSFREKTGAFRKITKNQAELVFLSAPNLVPPHKTEDGESETENHKDLDERGWWFSREDDYFKAQDKTNCAKGYEKSLEVVKQAFLEKGPFDGVLGFSQGAALVSLLCSLQELKPDGPIKFDFAILVASFKSNSQQHQYLYETKVTIPTLHVFGETDGVIPKDMSEELLQHYENYNTLQHPGGHFLPSSSPQKKIYIQFLEQQIENKKKKKNHLSD